MEHPKQELSSRFHALPNHTLCFSSGLDRLPYKNISVFLIFCPLVMIFDSLFDSILVVEESMSTYTHVLSICSFPISFKPRKHISIVINVDSAVFRGKNMGCH